MVPSANADEIGMTETAIKANRVIFNISSMKKSQVYMN
jgi:hypothetical protein